MRQHLEETSKINMSGITKITPYIITAAAIGLTLFAIFALDAWAEVSGWHHAAQHATIFTSGAAAGVSLLGTLKNRKDILK